MHPLFIYVWNNIYWCTSDYREVPLTCASHPIHTTKERVCYFLENPSEVKKEFPEIFKLVEEKYKQKIIHIIDYSLYELPDVNWSECNVDD